MDRHGAQAWRTAGSIQAELQTGGLLWATRGRRGFRGDALVATRTVRTVLNRFPGDGRRGVFEPGRVWIETNDGRVADERFGALGHPTLVSIDIADARLHGADETAPERRALMSAHAFGAR